MFKCKYWWNRNEALINIGNFSLEQYIDIPISKENTASMGGALRTNGKFGGGSIIGSFRRILSSDTYLNVICNIFIIMSIRYLWSI